MTYLTVPAQSGGGHYRVRASIEPQARNAILLIAASLNGVYGTLHRLVLIELLVRAAVLGALAALGLWVVRLGLRPLRSIEGPSAAIAAGDLTRRVEPADERAEVGRLGLALNAMLGHIESAFKEREASEQRAWSSKQKLRRFVADLSIVAAVAEAHGGTVDARSEAGHGTTFRIVLPLSPEQHNGAS